jgi:hypothetical protein
MNLSEQPSIWQQIGTALTTPGTEFQLPVKIPVELDKKTTQTVLIAAGLLAGGLIIAEYIQAAKQNRKNNVKSFKAFRKNEQPVKVGDLICYPRQNGVSYDTPGNYYAHCDLITEIKNNKAVTIGGNVSDTVKKSTYNLDADNKVTTEKVHAIIKTYL